MVIGCEEILHILYKSRRKQSSRAPKAKELTLSAHSKKTEEEIEEIGIVPAITSQSLSSYKMGSRDTWEALQMGRKV
jgi:hypothetical protein